MARPLPHETDQRFLVFAATGTDLIFNRGVEVPGFATFALVEDPEVQPVIVAQMRDLIEVAKATGMGCIIDTLTWMANRDRAAPFGFDEERLKRLNQTAVDLMLDLRRAHPEEEVLVALCLGPARDAYGKEGPMALEEARAYHRPQIAAVADRGIDLVHAYTFNHLGEAAGAALAATDLKVPVVVSLVVETDGCLVDGTPLEAAVDQIDALTQRAPAYYMVNCAHPDHFSSGLTGHPRLKGMVVNASRCSHAELDEAEELDAGDPEELGAEIGRLAALHPSFSVFGGCCGTDMHHLKIMAEQVMS